MSDFEAFKKEGLVVHRAFDGWMVLPSYERFFGASCLDEALEEIGRSASSILSGRAQQCRSKTA